MTYADYSDKVIPVDLAAVLRDEALVALPDGPAKRFLTLLSAELDYDDGPPPVLIVRRP
jgi:hypothetical protein